MKKRQKDISFLQNYLTDFSYLIKPNKEIVNNLIKVRDIILKTSKKKAKY